MKSPLKYAGGKQKLLDKIKVQFPKEFNVYYEPFLGSGAVFLNTEAESYYINDINKSVIGFFKDTLENCDQLVQILKTYTDSFENYVVNRKRFNEIKEIECIERSALLYYLNKCCFNGLYRENKKGEFNVPYSTKRKIIDFSTRNYEDILKTHEILKSRNVIISSYDYTIALNNASKNDFVYIDPPYDDTFTTYTKYDFCKEQQIELKEFIDNLTLKGVYVLLSNSDTEMIRKIYSNYNIISLNTVYTIGSKRESRGKIKNEVLIKNF